MSEIKIGIIGGDSETRRTLMRALAKLHGDKQVSFEDCIDGDEGKDLKQWEPLRESDMPKVKKQTYSSNNKWRGGSRGKGGKTKWPRR